MLLLPKSTITPKSGYFKVTPLLLLTLIAAPSLAATRFVSVDNSADNGDCSIDSCATITYASDQAENGDQLFISAGEYQLSSGLTLNKSLTLTGSAQAQVILDGALIDSSVITIESGATVSISGLSIINGSGNIRGFKRVGGGIDNQGQLTLTHVSIRDNKVEGDNSTIFLGGTYSPLGGGIYSAPGASLTLEYSTLDNNIVTSQSPALGTGGGGGALGGGIAAEGSNVNIRYSTLSNNQAIAEDSSGGGGGAVGGAIYIADDESSEGVFSEGILTVDSSTLSNNQVIGGSINALRPIFGSGGSGAGGDCGNNCAFETGNFFSGGNGGEAQSIAGGGGGAGAEIDALLPFLNPNGGLGGSGAFLGGGGGGGLLSSNDNGTTGTGGAGGFGAGGGAAGWAIPDYTKIIGAAEDFLTNISGSVNDPDFWDSVTGIENPSIGDQGMGGYGAGDGFVVNDFQSGSGAGAGIGAAIFANEASEVEITHSTLSLNNAEGGIGNIDGRGNGQGIGAALFNNGAALFELTNLALIENQADTQTNCAIADGSGESKDGGSYNAGPDSLSDSIDCDGFGLSATTAALLALADNGGPTLTHSPESEDSLNNVNSDCASLDQRQMPRGTPCDSGAVDLDSSVQNSLFPSLNLNIQVLTYSGTDAEPLFPSADVSDADGEDYDTLTISISSDEFVDGEDQLSLDFTDPSEWELVSAEGAAWLLHNGIVKAELLEQTDRQISIQFNRLDSSALVNSLLSAIWYQNNTGTPSTDLRSVLVALKDLQGNVGSTDMKISTSVLTTPIALDVYVQVVSGAEVTISLDDYIKFPDGDSLINVALSGEVLGNVVLDAEANTVTYSADPGMAGAGMFTYSVNSINGTSNLATVYVTVLPDSPTAGDDDLALNLESGLPPIELNILVNDTANYGIIDPTSVTIVSPTQGGELVLSEDKITYQANDQTRVGDDSFTYQVKDSNGWISNIATATLSITAPSVSTTADNASLDAGNTLMIDVVANDSSGIVEWDLSTLTVVSGPTHGSVSFNAENTQINYSASGTFTGDDEFQYQISNTLGQQSNATAVSVTVRENPPTAQDDSATVSEGSTVSIDVFANDIHVADIDYASLTFSPQQPSLGSVEFDSADNVFLYTANSGSTGADQFTYQFSDSNGWQSNQANVFITINDGSNDSGGSGGSTEEGGSSGGGGGSFSYAFLLLLISLGINATNRRITK